VANSKPDSLDLGGEWPDVGGIPGTFWFFFFFFFFFFLKPLPASPSYSHLPVLTAGPPFSPPTHLLFSFFLNHFSSSL
jgi:hypothetical protein